MKSCNVILSNEELINEIESASRMRLNAELNNDLEEELIAHHLLDYYIEIALERNLID